MASNSSIVQRIQAVALLELKYKVPDVEKWTGMKCTQIYYWRKEAKKRGWNPKESIILKEEYIQDAFRSGRPII